MGPFLFVFCPGGLEYGNDIVNGFTAGINCFDESCFVLLIFLSFQLFQKLFNIVPGKSILETAAPEVLTVKTTKEKSETSLDTKGKGRPKLRWDDDDILQIFTECQEKGWSVAKALIQHGLAERG